MKKLLLSLVLLAASLGLQVQAQNLLFFNQTNSQAHLVKLNGGGPSQGITNQMIQRIARGNSLAANRTEWVIVHEEVLRMTQKNLTSYNVYAALSELRLTGSKAYRSMDMTREMTPSVVHFDVQVLAANGQVIMTKQYTNVPLQGTPIVLAEFTVTDTSGAFTQNRVQLVNKRFIYSQQDWNNFKLRADLTDQYYTDIQELDKIQGEIASVAPQNFDLIDDEQARLQAIEQRIQGIGQKDYNSKLRLKRGEDPGDFQAKYNAALEEASLKREEIDKTLATLPALYYERGLAKRDNGNIRGASRDFNRALQYDANFGPAHVGLADLDAMQGNRQGAVDRIRSVFNNMNPDPNTQASAFGVLARLVDSHIMEGKALTSEGRFQEALGSLSAGGELCAEFPGLGCPQELDRSMADAHMGIFRSHLAQGQQALGNKDYATASSAVQAALVYQEQNAGFIGNSTEGQALMSQVVNAEYSSLLVQSERAFRIKDLDMAEAKGSQALEVAVANPNYINNDSQARLLLDRIAEARYEQKVAEARSAFSGGDLQNAELLAQEAVSIQEKYAAVLPNKQEASQLLLQIKDAQYKQLVAEGAGLVNQGLFQAGLDKLEAARSIEQSYAVQKDGNLVGLLQQAAKPVILKEIEAAKAKAQANQLQAAREIGQRIVSMQETYGLTQEEEIVNSFQSLRESIFNQECMNAQTEYNAALRKANALVSQKDYVAAEQAFAAALGISNQNQACALDVSAGTAEQKRIQPAAEYQRRKANAMALIDRRNFSNGLKAYEGAGEYYANNGIASFGLSHDRLFDVAMDHNKRDFQFAAARHFANKEEEISSVKLMKSLLSKGYPKGAMKNLMRQVGGQLATKDFSEDPNRSWKTLALSYTDGNKGLKNLYKGYKKQWKRLD